VEQILISVIKQTQFKIYRYVANYIMQLSWSWIN